LLVLSTVTPSKTLWVFRFETAFFSDKGMAFLEFLKIYFLGFYFVLGFAGDESSEYNKVEGRGRL